MGSHESYFKFTFMEGMIDVKFLAMIERGKVQEKNNPIFFKFYYDFISVQIVLSKSVPIYLV